MNARVLRTFIVAFLSGFTAIIAAQPAALIIKNADGKDMIVDSDHPVIGSGAAQIRAIGSAEGLVFSTQGRSKKKYRPAEKIFTGVYSSQKSEKRENVPGTAGDFFSSQQDADLDAAVPGAGAEKKTIAWITREGDFFHDPFLECGSHTSRIWVSELEKLSGIEPCQNCFLKTAHAPEFIKNESGGLDLATAGALLDNPGFLAWLEQNLPVKKGIFLTSRKLLIYPKMEMTSDGLRELAHETAMAYRRHTWKVIEVLAKKDETDLENISSH